jgi:hypothetical protein
MNAVAMQSRALRPRPALMSCQRKPNPRRRVRDAVEVRVMYTVPVAEQLVSKLGPLLTQIAERSAGALTTHADAFVERVVVVRVRIAEQAARAAGVAGEPISSVAAASFTRARCPSACAR